MSPTLYTIDCIDVSSSFQGGFSEKIAELHQKGHSLRDISATLGIGKTTAQEALNKNGISTTLKDLRKRGIHVGAAPYGYVLVQGKLVPDPKEQKIVQMIMSQWKSGKAYNAIAKNLHAKSIAPRTAKAWDHSTIRSIVERHQNEN